MNINESKHEIREEMVDELPTYEDLAGECSHNWRFIEDEGIEECVLCGAERDFFVSLDSIIYAKSGMTN